MGPWKQAFFIQHDLSIHPKCRQYESRYYECRYYKWDPISHFDPTKKLSYSLTAYYHRFKLLILLLVFFAMGIPLGIPYCIIEINEDWVRIEKKIIPKAMGHKFCCIQRLPNNLTDNLWSEPGFALTVAFNDKMTKQGELKKIDFIPVVDESPGAGACKDTWTLEVHLCFSTLNLIERCALWKRNPFEDKCNKNVMKLLLPASLFSSVTFKE